MKKKSLYAIICALTILSLLLAMAACTDNQGETEEPPKGNENNITVFSDTHVLAAEQYGDVITSGLRRILNRNEKAIGLTEAILKTAIDDFIASDSPILIITGDLTDDGAEVAHRAVARELKRAEDAGKKCFVINGNHDINNHATSYINEQTEDIANVSPELFREIYNEFGYSESIVQDDKTLSYTAELTEKYRLIAFDLAYYTVTPGTERSVEGRHEPHVTEERLDWLKMQLEACRDDGKEPFLITHFPILSHIGPIAGSMSHVNMQKETLEVLYDYNVKFSFCGHVHQQDIASYTFAENDVYNEIETGSLSFTNLPVRHFVDDGTEVKITTTQQSYVNPDYVPAFYSTEEVRADKEAFLADLPSYVWKYENRAFATYMFGKFYIDDWLGYLGIDDLTLLDKTQEIIDGFFNMPLYGENSLQSICEGYGIDDFPVLDDAETIGELLASIVKYNFAGDENFQRDDPVIKQLTYAVCTALLTLQKTNILYDLGLITPSENTLSDATIEELFATGKIEIAESGILELVSHVKALKNNSFVSGLIVGETSLETANKLKTLTDSAADLLAIFTDPKIEMIVNAVYDEEKGFSGILDFSQLEEGKAYLSIEGLVDSLFKDIGAGLLQDEGATDNAYSFASPNGMNVF